MWITVNYLGEPDNGIILASYMGSILMGGAFLVIGLCVSAFTKNQIIAFVISILICLLFNLSGFSILLDSMTEILPDLLIDTLSKFSFTANFDAITKGLIEIY